MTEKIPTPNPDFQYGSQGYYSSSKAVGYARAVSCFPYIYNGDMGTPAVTVGREQWYSLDQMNTLVARAEIMAENAEGLPGFSTNGEDIVQRMRLFSWGAACFRAGQSSRESSVLIKTMQSALYAIRSSGNNEHPWSLWAQKTAAWGMEPDKFPKQEDQGPKVIDLNTEFVNEMGRVYEETYGPLPKELCMNDIQWHVLDLIKQKSNQAGDPFLPTPPEAVLTHKGKSYWDVTQVAGYGMTLYYSFLRRLAFPFQERVRHWLTKCFGNHTAYDLKERNYRFGEEALELIQACGATAEEAHQLVDYVFSRPVGEKKQEMGGVMVTLAALALANNISMVECGEEELARVNTDEMIDKIRRKNASKPKFGPLPGKG